MKEVKGWRAAPTRGIEQYRMATMLVIGIRLGRNSFPQGRIGMADSMNRVGVYSELGERWRYEVVKLPLL